MTDDKDNVIKGVAGVVAPVVHDLTRPAAQEIGRFTAHGVRAVLLPLTKLLNLWEGAVQAVSESVEHLLTGLPPDEIGEPASYIAGPTLEALRFAQDEDSLRALYAGLLATAMHRPSSSRAHPAFVEIIKQLSPSEARMVRALSDEKARPTVDVWRRVGPRKPGIFDERLRQPLATRFHLLDDEVGVEQSVGALDNIERLGLIDVRMDLQILDGAVYEPFLTHAEIAKRREAEILAGNEVEFTRGLFVLSSLGKLFVQCCVKGPAA